MNKANIDMIPIMIGVLLILLIATGISIIKINNIQDKACVKIGYDYYSEIGKNIGICENENSDFVMVKMKCDRKTMIDILLKGIKCTAIKKESDSNGTIFVN